MAAGVPNLATSVGGVPEIAVHGENALLVQKGDSVEMARGIMRLLADTGLRARLSENGRKIMERYTPASYRRHVVQIYTTLLETQMTDQR
jgi:glycosyltransferase involved in cell wall biosynthesis